MKKAFTLIELLVVIAIIAILAAILFPVFAQAKLAAKGAASLSNAKQLGLASLMYANDFDDAFVTQPTGQWQQSWIMLELPYCKSYDIFKDPTDTVPLDPNYNSGPKFSYVANGILMGSPSGASPFWQFHGVIDTTGATWFQSTTRSQTQIPRVAETILFATRSAATKGGGKDPYAAGGSLMEGVFSPWNAVIDNTSGVDCSSLGCVLPGYVNPWGMPVPSYKGMVDRTYGGKSPVCYSDGHTKSMTPEATVNPAGTITWGQIAFESDNSYEAQWDALRP